MKWLCSAGTPAKSWQFGFFLFSSPLLVKGRRIQAIKTLICDVQVFRSSALLKFCKSGVFLENVVCSWMKSYSSMQWQVVESCDVIMDVQWHLQNWIKCSQWPTQTSASSKTLLVVEMDNKAGNLDNHIRPFKRFSISFLGQFQRPRWLFPLA